MVSALDQFTGWWLEKTKRCMVEKFMDAITGTEDIFSA